MKLQQLRYIIEVAKHQLNVSATAQSLFTSQPGISKQIRQLEDELGVEIFSRSGKHLTHITPAGEKIIAAANDILIRAEGIKRTAQEFSDVRRGTLSIATTHTQARYALPTVINQFIANYPDVSLQMQQGTPSQIAELAAQGKVDFAIATEAMEHFSDLVMMPCFHWNRSIVVQKDHPLAKMKNIALQDIAMYPIVTYTFGFTGRSKLDMAFKEANLDPKVVFTAVDSDVIKAYVKLGLGIGIIASMAFEQDQDNDLVCIDASHLFSYSTTRIGIRRGTLLRTYMYEFIESFSPNLTKAQIDAALCSETAQEVEDIFKGDELPVR